MKCFLVLLLVSVAAAATTTSNLKKALTVSAFQQHVVSEDCDL
jgi:hypothetical protein